MSVQASFGYADDPGAPIEDEDLCTISGWVEFGNWAETLPMKEYLRVAQVWHHGYVYSVAELGEQLKAAARKSKPPKSAAAIVKNLAALCKRHARATSIVIGDGA
jgi:hypothetical protein